MYGEGQRCLSILPCPSLCRRHHSIVAAPCFFLIDGAIAALNLCVLPLTIGAVSKTLAALPPRRFKSAVIAEPDNPPLPQNKGPDSGMILGPSGCGEALD